MASRWTDVVTCFLAMEAGGALDFLLIADPGLNIVGFGKFEFKL